MANKQGKVFPSAFPARGIHQLFRDHLEHGWLSTYQSSGHSHPATEARYPSHRGSVNCDRTGTRTHNRTGYCYDKSHCTRKASTTKCLSSSRSTIKLGLPAPAGRSHASTLSCPLLTKVTARRSLYLAIVKPHLCNASEVWSPCQKSLKVNLRLSKFRDVPPDGF